MKKWKLTIKVGMVTMILSLGVIISGCTAVDRLPNVIRGSHLVSTDIRIVNGETTKEEILKWLGEPKSKGTDNNGREKWIYNSSGIEPTETRLDVTFQDEVVYLHRVSFSEERRRRLRR